MKSSQIHKRLEKLITHFRPHSVRSLRGGTLPLLLADRQKGFRQLTDEAPMFRSLLAGFEREDAEREQRRTPTQTAKARSGQRKRKGSTVGVPQERVR